MADMCVARILREEELAKKEKQLAETAKDRDRLKAELEAREALAREE